MHDSKENFTNLRTRRWMIGSSLIPLLAAVAAYTCAPINATTATPYAERGVVVAQAPTIPKLPPPDTTNPPDKQPNVIGWPAGRTPTAPKGFTVSLYADRLDHPRWLYVLPNGDVLVAEANTVVSERDLQEMSPEELAQRREAKTKGSSANRITLLRDANRDGIPEVRSTFLTGLNRPLGMLLRGDTLYVANTDSLMRYPYRTGQTRITARPTKILDLPAGGYNNHWTRNLIASPDGSKIYVAVGSGSNVGENGIEQEKRRANILEINPDGSGERIFASGLRNPVGMGWAPGTNTLYTAVNERDELGDDLVPDYLTSVREGAFYGWPYSYFGQNEDPRRKGERPDLVAAAVVPDVPLGSHTASLGLAFYEGTAFPKQYQGGAFIGQHGSWNRSRPSGYKVVYVPFTNGRPSGPQQDFLTGFIADVSASGIPRVYGRPVGVTTLPDGSLLVADDAADRIWRVTYTGK